MATDGPDPPDCDKEIFQKGQSVAVIDGSSNAVEKWVKSVAKKADARVDWHYTGGIANMLHLGDAESRARVEMAINELGSTLEGRIMRRYCADEPGLYRNGVTQVPTGAIAGFMDPLSGNATYIVESDKK